MASPPSSTASDPVAPSRGGGAFLSFGESRSNRRAIHSPRLSEESEVGVARRDLSGAVDFAYLEGYAANDAALIEEVLGMFKEQAELWVRLLDPAASTGWRDAAHTLKGAARGIGAGAVAETCEAAEMAEGADPGQKQVMLDRIRDALDQALADIAAYRHELALRSLKTPR
jgi:HPt (histidine-containing phosphotransfer) domain-containing protein